ncbi:hypothetical protein GOP47_0004209 [Adiantum capillus-veneris]|uniref:Uncharacterized protein n=1 Tax=Adiantum capillus-veneris TaxID=13818 RepID=A0A9D4ZPI5_ADICA|nr:hypothetical protein GOP47_0004209 [Adiantum capillus-veneris]
MFHTCQGRGSWGQQSQPSNLHALICRIGAAVDRSATRQQAERAWPAHQSTPPNSARKISGTSTGGIFAPAGYAHVCLLWTRQTANNYGSRGDYSHRGLKCQLHKQGQQLGFAWRLEWVVPTRDAPT